MSGSKSHASLLPEVLPPRRPRGLYAAAVAAALGGAVGAAAVGVTAWHLGGIDRAPMAVAAPPLPRPVSQLPALVVPAIDIDVDLDFEPAPAPPLSGRAALIVYGAGPMVSVADPLPEWQRGTPVMLDSDDFSRTLGRAVTAAVPDIYKKLSGSRLIAIDEAGKRCDVTAGELSIVGTYHSELDEPETAAELTEAWDYVSPTLAVAIDVPDDCGELKWAVLPDGDPGASLRTAAVDTASPLANKLRDRLRALPRWAGIQKEVGALEDGPWDDNATRLFAVIGSADSGVAVAAAVSYPCEAGGDITALWRVRDGELGGMIAIPGDVVLSEIIGAADLNNDGLPEIIYRNDRLQTGVLVSGDGAYTNAEGPETLSHICPC